MISLLAYLFIRNISLLIQPFSAELAEIFLAMKSSAIVPAFQFPLLLVGLFVLPFHCFRRRPRWWAVPLAVLVVLLSFAGAVWFASVNGVLFGDVVRSLLSLVKQGVLDAL